MDDVCDIIMEIRWKIPNGKNLNRSGYKNSSQGSISMSGQLDLYVKTKYTLACIKKSYKTELEFK